MDNIRELEIKFSEEINNHIKKALPKLADSFSKYRPSTSYEDGTLCFDLVYGLNFTVSVRIRKNKYLKYNDLTIRSRSKMGNKTEIDKIMEGMAQIYFYAYMNEEETKLVKVRMVNVDSIRELTETGNFYTKNNKDGTKFNTYSFFNIKIFKGDIYKFN